MEGTIVEREKFGKGRRRLGSFWRPSRFLIRASSTTGYNGGQVIGGSLINIWFIVRWWTRRSKFLGKHVVTVFRFEERSVRPRCEGEKNLEPSFYRRIIFEEIASLSLGALRSLKIFTNLSFHCFPIRSRIKVVQRGEKFPRFDIIYTGLAIGRHIICRAKSLK